MRISDWSSDVCSSDLLAHPRQLLAVKAEQLAGPAAHLERLSPRLLGERARELDGLGRVLESVSYKRVLQRGYAVVRGPQGAITKPEGVTPGLALEQIGRAHV